MSRAVNSGAWLSCVLLATGLLLCLGAWGCGNTRSDSERLPRSENNISSHDGSVEEVISTETSYGTVPTKIREKEDGEENRRNLPEPDNIQAEPLPDDSNEGKEQVSENPEAPVSNNPDPQ